MTIKLNFLRQKVWNNKYFFAKRCLFSLPADFRFARRLLQQSWIKMAPPKGGDWLAPLEAQLVRSSNADEIPILVETNMNISGYRLPIFISKIVLVVIWFDLQNCHLSSIKTPCKKWNVFFNCYLWQTGFIWKRVIILLIIYTILKSHFDNKRTHLLTIQPLFKADAAVSGREMTL